MKRTKPKIEAQGGDVDPIHNTSGQQVIQRQYVQGSVHINIQAAPTQGAVKPRQQASRPSAKNTQASAPSRGDRRVARHASRYSKRKTARNGLIEGYVVNIDLANSRRLADKARKTSVPGTEDPWDLITKWCQGLRHETTRKSGLDKKLSAMTPLPEGDGRWFFETDVVNAHQLAEAVHKETIKENRDRAPEDHWKFRIGIVQGAVRISTLTPGKSVLTGKPIATAKEFQECATPGGTLICPTTFSNLTKTKSEGGIPYSKVAEVFNNPKRQGETVFAHKRQCVVEHGASSPRIRQTREQQAAPVTSNYRAKVIEAMEDMLSRSELRSLVAKLVRVQKFGRMTEDRFVLSNELRSGPEAVYDVLIGIEESLEDGPLHGTLKPAERTTLDVIVGGVVLLGMSPGWMADQFQEHRTGKAVKIPSDDGDLTVDEEKGISADVLALVSAAFFERRANLDGLLERIFRRGVAASADMGLGDVLQGVGEEDIYFELKRHLVAVLHQKKEARAKAGRLPAKTKSSDIEIWFKQLIGYVNRWYDKGTPRYLSHKSYAAHLPRIRELGLDKLLFLIPVKGDFDKAFERHVEVLMTSWDLHKRLSK